MTNIVILVYVKNQAKYDYHFEEAMKEMQNLWHDAFTRT